MRKRYGNELCRNKIGPCYDKFDIHLRSMVHNTYWSALNTIEDQRIESQMSRLWLGNKQRFEKAKHNVGKEMKDMSDTSTKGLTEEADFSHKYGTTPVECLLAVRFYRDDIAKTSPAYKRAVSILQKVVGTGQTGGMIDISGSS